MIVSRIILKNWRNFRQADARLGERAFLVGPNASGKSNFLDALRFVRDIAKPGGGLQKAVSERGGLSRIRCLAARRYPDVEIEVQLSNSEDPSPLWRYGLGIKQDVRGYRQPKVSYERVWHKDELKVDRPDAQDQEDEVRLTQTALEQINANASFRGFAQFAGSALYIHLVPQLLRYPDAFSGPGVADDPFGRNFLERVARTPEKTRKSRLKKIEAALRFAVPQLRELTEVKDERGGPHLEAIYEHWRPHGAKQREDQFSDGTLRLVGLLWSLLENDTVLLLEEPELSLNASIVAKLPPLIHRMQRQRGGQVIISTHSADLLADPGIGAEEILLLTPTLDGTRVEQASDLDDVKALLGGGLTLAEAILPRTAPPMMQKSGQLRLGLFE
jgi:predicted ATPase